MLMMLLLCGSEKKERQQVNKYRIFGNVFRLRRVRVLMLLMLMSFIRVIYIVHFDLNEEEAVANC